MKKHTLLAVLLTLAALALGGCSAADDPGVSSAAHGGELLPDAELPDASVACTRTQGHWKNHPDEWPVAQLTFASRDHSREELLVLFATPPRGDASLILAHQLIAAWLNGGASHPAIAATITAAMEWMTANVDLDGALPFGTRAGSPAHMTATRLADQLAAYNEGFVGPGHCPR